ncbi:unnamed protein product, partial [Scytosiphon promiscuus]
PSIVPVESAARCRYYTGPPIVLPGKSLARLVARFARRHKFASGGWRKLRESLLLLGRALSHTCKVLSSIDEGECQQKHLRHLCGKRLSLHQRGISMIMSGTMVELDESLVFYDTLTATAAAAAAVPRSSPPTRKQKTSVS